MAQKNTLYLLVHSLTKAEKRYFKLYTALQKGTKDYLYVFELLKQGNDAEAAKEIFCKKKHHSSFEAACKYLFKVITDCLLYVRINDNINTRLTTELIKAKILFEKSIYEEGFKQLRKIQHEAAELQEFEIQLQALRIEMYYLNNLNYYSITENELVKKQIKMDELLKYQKNIHQHTSLYELLRHRLMYKSSIKTKEQKEELNDLVVSELNYKANPLANTFESQKIHLLFQAYYFITVSDYKSALKTFYEVHELFEIHKKLWLETPIDYLSAVEGLLDSLHSIKHYDEMNFFVNKLHQLEKKTVYFGVMVERVRFIYTIRLYIDSGQFNKAEEIIKEFNEILIARIDYLDLNKQAEIYLYMAIVYLGKNNVNKAHKLLNKILLESNLFYSLPVYRTFRLLHLLVHYELGNHEYIESETRSLKRTSGVNHNKSYKIEKIVFKFLRYKTLPSTSKNREAVWNQFKKSFELSLADKYEQQFLKIFDFASWIESKLCKKHFEKVLIEKFSGNQ